MRIPVTQPPHIAAVQQAINQHLPQYKTEIKRNPLMGFEYLEVRKTDFAGAWIRVKDSKITVDGVVPSTAARIFLGGLLLLLITMSARKEVSKNCSDVIRANFQ